MRGLRVFLAIFVDQSSHFQPFLFPVDIVRYTGGVSVIATGQSQPQLEPNVGLVGCGDNLGDGSRVSLLESSNVAAF